ncbi:hypothetical protein [Kitasatospora sp. NPDC050463]|uniref:hypothetical protein n=1 Tax=Kitasatospora sp. NPDC050463 TaxID=3155786 RepID=UPI0033DACBF1
MDTNEPAASLPDNLLHHLSYSTELQSWPEAEPLRRAFGLMSWAIGAVAKVQSDIAMPNDTAAAAAFGRCFWQLRAALVLAEQGFNSEVRNIIRSVYESAGTGRMLAKEAAQAEQWLRKGEWWPERKVRDWLRTARNESEEGVKIYTNFYRLASAWAHPTAESCMGLMVDDGTTISPMPEIAYNAEASRQAVREITLATVFACFALKNAVVDESVLDPNWRQELSQLARDLSGEPMEHLDRDWQAEQERFKVLLAKVRSADTLDEALRNHPRSFHNLNAEIRPGDPEEE